MYIAHIKKKIKKKKFRFNNAKISTIGNKKYFVVFYNISR